MLFAIASLLISAILLWLGLRGRQLGSQPVCRNCGYDLSGRPDRANKCSECGADLNRASAIRTGRRRRSWAKVLAAGALAIPTGAWLGLPRVRDLAARDWEPIKPTFWVIRDVASGDRVLAQRATDELARRLDAGKLTSANVERLATILLKLQPGTPPSRFDDVLELARARGQLGDEQWAQYWRQAFPLQLNASCTSDSLQLLLSTDEQRWRCHHRSDFKIEATGRLMRIGTREFDAANLTLVMSFQGERGGGLMAFKSIPLTRGNPVNSSVFISAHLEVQITDTTVEQTKPIAAFPLDLSTSVALPPGKVPEAETDR